MCRKIILPSVVLSLALICVFFVSVCIGMETYSPSYIFNQISGFLFAPAAPSVDSVIIMDIRIPRVLLSMFVGASLSLAGAAFQGLLRNPLADPYIVGTSSGAALGASIAVVLNLSFMSSPVLIFAFLGSVLVMSVVYFMSIRSGRLSVETFLLSGVIAGAFCSSFVSFLMTVAGKDMPRIVWWLMGSFSGREDWGYVLFMLPYFLIGFVILILCSNSLNLLSMGEDVAISKGINVERSKILVIFAACLLTAVSVSVAGTIGFVGFMIPHVMRRIYGGDHRILMLSSAFGGAVFLALADTLSRVCFSSAELPVGVITALMGAPFFFFILRKRML